MLITLIEFQTCMYLLVCSHGYGLGFRGEFLWQVSDGCIRGSAR
jgi:hypothetical protein